MKGSKNSPIPNLFIIGAMKSGTTSLHEYLNKHPEIFMSDIKEPGYFAECVNYYPKDYEWYMSLFSGVTDEIIVGESSTHYTKLPFCDGVVQKLWEYNPNARLIYIMRHPVKRAISHYWHGVKYGDEHRDILTAIIKNHEYIAFSDYAYQLQPYIERFGNEKILTLTFEELISNPKITLKYVFDWLGVSSKYSIDNIQHKYNALPESFKKVKGLGVLYKFRKTTFWNAVAPLVPKNIKSAAAKLTQEDTTRSLEKEEEVTKILEDIFIEKVKNLQTLLNKRFDEWNY